MRESKSRTFDPLYDLGNGTVQAYILTQVSQHVTYFWWSHALSDVWDLATRSRKRKTTANEQNTRTFDYIVGRTNDAILDYYLKFIRLAKRGLYILLRQLKSHISLTRIE